MPDPGSPHTHPDDYPKLGLDFDRDNAAIAAERGPSEDPQRDVRIQEQVCQRLESNQFVEERCIRVESRNGQVTLEGIVDNRFARERAEQLAREVEGVQSVENRVHIQLQEDAAGGPVLTVHDPSAGSEPSTRRS